jgi:hypothetical protein
MRSLLTIADKKCVVCGEDIGEEKVVIALHTNASPPTPSEIEEHDIHDPEDSIVIDLDWGKQEVMHLACFERRMQ